MNKEEMNTISEEQVLHNELSFEINQEIIHLMKRIVQMQQALIQTSDASDKYLKALLDIKEYIKSMSDSRDIDQTYDIWYSCKEYLLDRINKALGEKDDR